MDSSNSSKETHPGFRQRHGQVTEEHGHGQVTEKLNFCMSKLYQDGKKYLLGSFDDQLYILDIAECH